MNSSNAIRALWGVTIFVAATLLFAVQPMVAKALLPALGGSSAVWTTCMLFFQFALLAGYAWAHGGTARLPPRVLLVGHAVVVAVAGATLPFELTADVDAAGSPVTWIVGTLTLTVGPAFLALAATSPLLQAWYARLGLPDSDDPYFLYSASNLGSMLALLAYPFLIEPVWGVSSQLRYWSGGFWLLGLLIAACVVVTWRRGGLAADSPQPTEPESLRWSQIGGWVALAFVPSSLMLGATHYITIDLAPVPLLWVLPLAAYLASFIVVFGRDAWRIPRRLYPWIPVAILGLIALEGFGVPMALTITAHIVLFSVLALLFHGWLADARPSAGRLTAFYLSMAFGGALGGLFNGVVAPLVFDRNVDYLLLLAVAIVAVPVGARHFDELRPRTMSLVVMGVVGALFVWAIGGFPWPPFRTLARLGEWGLSCTGIGLALALSYWRPRLHHLAYAIIFAVGSWSILHTPGAVRYDRSFYATYKVFDRTYGGLEVRKFSHGSTSHGAQFLDPKLRRTPTAYHHPSGPVGQVVAAFPHRRAAVIGLGIGAMAAYPEGEDHWDFYEIDPLVDEIARDEFTYLEDCGDRCSVLVGDGRLLLEEIPVDTYDIIFLDAYNSDSVPSHLLTREALALYRSRLAPGGVLVFHVSNRYIDVEGIVGALVADAGLHARTQVHYPPNELRRMQVRISAYVVVAEDEKTLAPIDGDERWRPVKALDEVWTDDHSNIVDALEF